MTASNRRPLAALGGLLCAVLALLLLLPSGAAQAAGVKAGDVPPGGSWVRVGHFVPGMGAASVRLTPLDGSGATVVLASSARYGQVTAYDKLTPGRYTATVRQTAAASGSAPMLSRSFRVTAGQARTVAVVGTVDQPRLVLLSDDLTPPAAGTARVRVLSASQAAGSVTVKAVDGPTIATDAVLGQATGYVTVPAGSWDLRLSSSGTESEQQVPIASGSVYTVVALDSGTDQVRLRVVTDAAGAMVRPRGGARTGEGGTAPGQSDGGPRASADLVVAVLLGVGLAAGAAGVVRRRRLVHPARG